MSQLKKKSFFLSIILHLVFVFIMVLVGIFSKPPVIKQVISLELVKSVPNTSVANPIRPISKEKKEENDIKVAHSILEKEKKIEIPMRQPTIKSSSPESSPRNVVPNLNVETKNNVLSTTKNSSPSSGNKEVVPNNVSDVPLKREPSPVLREERNDTVVNKQDETVLVPLPLTPVPERKNPLQIKKQDGEFNNFLNDNLRNIEDIPKDIDENKELTRDEIGAIKEQVAMCWAALGGLRENDIVVRVNMELGEDGVVKDISVDKESGVLNMAEWIVLEERIRAVFKRPQCVVLNVPVGKYNSWRVFSIKLTLKGFF